MPANEGVYEVVNNTVAVDLVWLCERLPRSNPRPWLPSTR
jgi:hypothetical protein